MFFAACNGAETKADTDSIKDKNEMTGLERPEEDKMPDSKPAASAAPDTTMINPGGNEIIARIDRYLVSTANLPEATVTIKNTLPNITFQKAFVEVSFLDPGRKLIRTDYFPIQNIEPGDTETIKLNVPANTASLVTHVVKIKSNALTNGEMVLAGTHFEEGK